MKTGTDIALAARLLADGNLVAIPTETVYGLAANAFNEDAVLKIFEAKNRPHFNPLIVHTHSIEKLSSFVTEISPTALKLAKALMPGALTLLLPKQKNISDLLTAGSPLVAVRIPNHPLTLSLLQRLDFPLAAPSANPFGYISPTTPEHVRTQMGNKVSYILDGGACSLGIESTIVGFDETDAPLIYRLGSVTVEQIEACSGKKAKLIIQEKKISAPGMLDSHYAPGTPFLLGTISELAEQYSGKKIGVLSFTKKYTGFTESYVLSQDGDLGEAAKSLFTLMRLLDEKKLDVILAEPVPDIGMGRAINDRLKRASVKMQKK